MGVLDLRETAPPAGVSKRVVARRHTSRWISLAVVVCLAALTARSMATNRAFGWKVVGHYFFSDPIVSGLLMTLRLTAMAITLAIVAGTLLATMRISKNPVLSGLAWAYAWIFRAVPTLVLLIVIYNIGALYPHLTLAIPFGPQLLDAKANDLITPMVAATLGLVLSETAYTSEIIRGGILGVDRGQWEAAWSLGMRRGQTLRRVVLPQAARIVIPPLGNQVIGMLKLTALVSVLSIGDLLYSAEKIYAANFQPIPLLMVATIWYLIIVSLFMIAQRYVERKLSMSEPSPQRRMEPIA